MNKFAAGDRIRVIPHHLTAKRFYNETGTFIKMGEPYCCRETAYVRMDTINPNDRMWLYLESMVPENQLPEDL